jgi:hypothetical protein
MQKIYQKRRKGGGILDKIGNFQTSVARKILGDPFKNQTSCDSFEDDEYWNGLDGEENDKSITFFSPGLNINGTTAKQIETQADKERRGEY